MKIHINGEQKLITGGETLSTYMENADYPLENIIVELNGQIVKKNKWDISKLADGDRIEIVVFVGGG